MMKNSKLIFKRTLPPNSEGGEKYTIRIFQPNKISENEWVCHFSISGNKPKSIQHTYGSDGLQAFLIALERIRILIGYSHHWTGGDKGDIGIPQYVPTYFGISFSKKIGALIESEVTKHSNWLKSRRLKK